MAGFCLLKCHLEIEMVLMSHRLLGRVCVCVCCGCKKKKKWLGEPDKGAQPPHNINNK